MSHYSSKDGRHLRLPEESEGSENLVRTPNMPQSGQSRPTNLAVPQIRTAPILHHPIAHMGYGNLVYSPNHQFIQMQAFAQTSPKLTDHSGRPLDGPQMYRSGNPYFNDAAHHPNSPLLAHQALNYPADIAQNAGRSAPVMRLLPTNNGVGARQNIRHQPYQVPQVGHTMPVGTGRPLNPQHFQPHSPFPGAPVATPPTVTVPRPLRTTPLPPLDAASSPKQATPARQNIRHQPYQVPQVAHTMPVVTGRPLNPHHFQPHCPFPGAPVTTPPTVTVPRPPRTAPLPPLDAASPPKQATIAAPAPASTASQDSNRKPKSNKEEGTNEYRSTCTDCSEVIQPNAIYMLINHIGTHDETAKRYKCATCGELTNLLSEMQLHISRKHGHTGRADCYVDKGGVVLWDIWRSLVQNYFPDQIEKLESSLKFSQLVHLPCCTPKDESRMVNELADGESKEKAPELPIQGP